MRQSAIIAVAENPHTKIREMKILISIVLD